jgi:hypothetical protein
MPDGVFTRDNPIAEPFPEKASAFEALARLKELTSPATIGVCRAVA